jgi:hypothetical protein
VDRFATQADAARDRAIEAMADAYKTIEKTRAPQPHIPAPAPRREPLTPSKAMGGSRPVAPPDRPARDVPPKGGNNGHESGTVTRPQQRILNALAWAESFNLPTQRREKVAFLADASPKSSAFMNNLGALRSAALIDYPIQGYVGLTPQGRAIADVDPNAPSTSPDLQRAICAKLPAPQARIVEAVVRAYPSSLDRAAVADAAGASPASSAFMNNLGALRSLGLLEYPSQGLVAASAVLFLEGRER